MLSTCHPKQCFYSARSGVRTLDTLIKSQAYLVLRYLERKTYYNIRFYKLQAFF